MHARFPSFAHLPVYPLIELFGQESLWPDHLLRQVAFGCIQKRLLRPAVRESMSNCKFCNTKDERYFEDYEPGCVYELGSIVVDETEMIEFARRFDPQVFHVDPEAAKTTVYGGLIASGWHTSALMMRLFVDHFLASVASLGSPGVDELRWTRPVRPGDVLAVRVTVMEAKRSRSKPDRGIIRSFVEVINGGNETVMTMNAVNFLLCREAG